MRIMFWSGLLFVNILRKTTKLRWGALYQFTSLCTYPNFPVLSKQMLAIENDVHIWQVKIKERSFSAPHPGG